MSSLQKVMAEALELAERDRASLAVRLIDSLDSESDEGADEAWSQEIERRVTDLDANPSIAVTWESVRKRIDERLAVQPEQPSK